MAKSGPLPRLYKEFSSWWTLLSAPEDYAEEAEFYKKCLIAACSHTPRTLLELGSGGGNNASHLKNSFQMTLVDLSPEMLEVSLKLNPECEHIRGDMRSIRLERSFDAVFIHDAIVYMTTEDDLQSAIETAFLHCKPGGAALFAPDAVQETFRSSTKHGGHDGETRSMRYLEWTWDPDPNDSTYITDFVYLFRDEGTVKHAYDRHVCGLFSQTTWLRLIQAAGFQPQVIPFEHSEIEPGTCDVFLGIRPSF